MKRFFVLLIALSAVLFTSCADRSPAEQEAVRQVRRQETAGAVLNSMIYFRDDRAKPPVCYGYVWVGYGHGGPAMAAVPCEAVEHLLVNR